MQKSVRPVVSDSNERKMFVLEVCIDRLGDALRAAESGANRLELCSALELGGLTPSAGLIKQCLRETDAELVALIRPRAGGFCYDQRDMATACRDADEALASGAHGLVFGFLHENGTIDADACRHIIEIAGTSPCVFHRALDFVPDASAALEELIQLRVTRVLTSGRQRSALAGAPLIGELVQQARGRIEIMPGGGIQPEQIDELIHITGCEQIHIGASLPDRETSLDYNPTLELRSRYQGGEYRSVDSATVVRAARQLHAAARTKNRTQVTK